MRLRYVIVAVLAVVTLVMIPGVAFAYCPCQADKYPPQLTEQQGTLWINTHPISRPYLARIWGINQYVAEYYGAKYKLPVNGMAPIPTEIIPPYTGSSTISETVYLDNSSESSVSIDMPHDNIDKTIPTEYNKGNVWENKIAVTDTFTPIPIVYPQLPQSTPIQIQFNAPPQLDTIQATRWHQALPWARKYLAILWGIPSAEAQKYGAR
jgi:hypothetical protein